MIRCVTESNVRTEASFWLIDLGLLSTTLGSSQLQKHEVVVSTHEHFINKPGSKVFPAFCEATNILMNLQEGIMSILPLECKGQLTSSSCPMFESILVGQANDTKALTSAPGRQCKH